MEKGKHKINSITFKGDSPIFFLAHSEYNWEVVLAGVNESSLKEKIK